MAELADATDSKSVSRKGVWVRPPPPAYLNPLILRGLNFQEDLKLEAHDLDVPADKALRNAIERCPAFITFCPASAKENPWLAGLNEQCVCLHCGSVYRGSWGIWKDSTTYRRTKELLTRPLEPGAVTLRANLPARYRETVAAALQLHLSFHALTGAAPVFLEPL